MEFFTNPFQGLVVADTKPGQPTKIISDYLNLKDDFAKAYDGFRQRDYVQLPGKLIQASKIGHERFEFVRTTKSPSNLERETEAVLGQLKSQFGNRSVPMDDNISMSTLESSNNRSTHVGRGQKGPSLMAFNDLQSIATSNTNFKSSEADALSSAPSSFYNVNVDDNESVISSNHYDTSNAMSESTVVSDRNSESFAFDKRTVSSNLDGMSNGSQSSDTIESTVSKLAEEQDKEQEEQDKT